jgi:Zn-dependent metalloprotease
VGACAGIVPPYLLEHLAGSDDPAVSAPAKATLAHDAVIRARRSSTRLVPPAEAVGTPGQPDRSVYTLDGGTTESDARLVRTEGGPATGDPAADEAYDGLGDTYTLYWDAYARDSIDGKGLPLVAWVHYGQRYDNAFWDGTRMVFGDGDGRVFQRFTRSVDVIGHELTHGVTASTVNLDYQDQPGALNESVSDVFGSLVKQHSLGQTAGQADWLIGAGLFEPSIHGVALRSLKAPGTAYDDPALGGKDPQPATMSGYVQTTSDNGGVHLNSGIPNHAFYLVATAIGGFAWERSGRVWYETLLDPQLPSTASFARFAQATLDAAARLYGAGGPEARAVAAGWDGVGVTPSAA